MGKPQLTMDEVKRICEENGWKLISTEYKNTTTKLELACENGHTNYKNINHIKEGRGCKLCRGLSERKCLDEIKEKAKSLGITILTDKYENAHTKMPTFCERGHYSEKTWNSIQKDRKCIHCTYENMSGKGNVNYDSSLPYEKRIKQRRLTGYCSWRRKVKERDNYTCRCCGKREVPLDTHHIFNYLKYPHLRLDINNGITLCEICHKEFHRKYGIKNNTREQLDEYMFSKRWQRFKRMNAAR